MGKLLVLLAVLADPKFGLSQGSVSSPPPRPPPPADRCEGRRPDATCSVDADCTAVRTVSCCGTVGYVGVNRSDAARFEALERRCSPGRRCGCAPGPTRLDDGSVLERGGQVAVACVQSRCVTRLEPAPQTACTAAECGPAPLYPTAMCPDGVHRSGRGPCARVNGRCGWVRLQCP